MSLPKMNLPDLDDFNEEDENLEDITEENLDEKNIKDNNNEDEEVINNSHPISHNEQETQTVNMFDDLKEMAEERFNFKKNKVKKKQKKLKGKSKGKKNLPIMKYLKTIGVTIVAILVVLFIIGKLFGNNGPQKPSEDKRESVSSDKDLEITDRGFMEGNPYITIKTKSDDIQVEFVETAFINSGNIIKCTAFNPYLEEGENTIKYEDCDGMFNDKEEMKQFIDNIKLKGDKKE